MLFLLLFFVLPPTFLSEFDFNGFHQRLHHNGVLICLNRYVSTSLIKKKKKKLSLYHPRALYHLHYHSPTHTHTHTHTHFPKQKNKFYFSVRISFFCTNKLCMCSLNLIIFCTNSCSKRLRRSIYMFLYEKGKFPMTSFFCLLQIVVIYCVL